MAIRNSNKDILNLQEYNAVSFLLTNSINEKRVKGEIRVHTSISLFLGPST